MRQLGGDIRYAWRGLVKTPVFTAIALVSIALGIGPNTAIFTIVDELLPQALPVPHPEQLVLFSGPRAHYGSNSGGNMLSFPMYEDLRDNFVDRGGAPAPARVSQPVDVAAPAPKIFSNIFARRPVALNVGVDGQTERVPAELASGTFFEALGVRPAVGRLITPDDDRERDAGYVAVLGYDYWRTRFAADPSIVGRRIAINNHPFTIVGVSQAGFNASTSATCRRSACR